MTLPLAIKINHAGILIRDIIFGVNHHRRPRLGRGWLGGRILAANGTSACDAIRKVSKDSESITYICLCVLPPPMVPDKLHRVRANLFCQFIVAWGTIRPACKERHGIEKIGIVDFDGLT